MELFRAADAKSKLLLELLKGDRLSPVAARVCVHAAYGMSDEVYIEYLHNLVCGYEVLPEDREQILLDAAFPEPSWTRAVSHGYRDPRIGLVMRHLVARWPEIEDSVVFVLSGKARERDRLDLIDGSIDPVK